MNTNLKDTIKILYDMELNNYLMTRGIQLLDQKISNLGYYYRFEEPKKREVKEYYRDLDKGCFLWCLIGGIPLGILSGSTIAGIIGAIIGTLGKRFFNYAQQADHFEEERRNAQKYYEEEVAAYNQALDNDELRVQAELKQQDFLTVQKNELVARLNKSKALLNSFYYSSGIDKRFCNIVAMGYMNEFIGLGISSKLEGSDGLYYLIMQELRWDQLNATLEDISRKLDTIIDNQKRIYYELQDMNQKCNSIINGINSLADKIEHNTEVQQTVASNTELSAYYSQRTAREAEFANYMRLYNVN